MPALKLFISHSSNLDETDDQGCPVSRNWSLLRDTCAAIREHYCGKVEILVDYENLTPANEWRGRLDGWLGDCDAAIILFSRRALAESQWVRFEASVLRWRSSRDPAFRLVPVLLEGEANPSDLEEGIWETIRIADKQCIRSAASGAQILTGLRTVLGDLDQPDNKTAFGARFKAIRDLIEECLNRDNHATSLQAVWEFVSGGQPPPTWPNDPVGRYALGITRLLFEDTEKSVQAFKHIVENMHPPFVRTRELFRYVRPLWVDAAAAGCIKAARSEGSFLALNGEFVGQSDPDLDTDCYTLDRYLERAVLRRGSIKVVQVPSPDAAAIRDEIRTSVDKQWRKYPQREALVDKRVRALEAPVIALVPAPEALPDPRLVDELKRLRDEKCPSLICVFATGASMPNERPSEIRPVLPELDLESEYRHYLDERDVRAALPGA